MRRGFFLPTQFLAPLQNATPPIQIPASFANALRTTPYCKSPPPPLLQIPARPSEFPPLPIPPRRNPPAPPLPPFLQIPASPTPFFQTCALKSAWSTCLQTFSAKLPLVDSCCSTQSMSAIVCSRRRQALFKWAARRLQAADPFHLGGCNGLQVGCKEAAPRSHRRDRRWTSTSVPSVYSVLLHVPVSAAKGGAGASALLSILCKFCFTFFCVSCHRYVPKVSPHQRQRDRSLRKTNACLVCFWASSHFCVCATEPSAFIPNLNQTYYGDHLTIAAAH